MNEIDSTFGNQTAYEAIRAFGVKYELFKIPEATVLKTYTNYVLYLKKLILPPIKIVFFGANDQSLAAAQLLKDARIKEVEFANIISKKYSHAVFSFANNVDFELITQNADILFYTKSISNSTYDLNSEILKSPKNRLKIICQLNYNTQDALFCCPDMATVEQPFYGYLPSENKVGHHNHPAAITVLTSRNIS
jgi:hypothetical protein